MGAKETKLRIIEAGEKAINELIKVAEQYIIIDGFVSDDDDDDVDVNLSADKLKNAAAAKKLAIFDAFEILSRIEAERNEINGITVNTENKVQGFAERRSK